jgi:hypothetical protein
MTDPLGLQLGETLCPSFPCMDMLACRFDFSTDLSAIDTIQSTKVVSCEFFEDRSLLLLLTLLRHSTLITRYPA